MFLLRLPACCLILVFAETQTSCNHIYYRTNTTHNIRDDTLRRLISEKKKLFLHNPEFVAELKTVRLDSGILSGDRQTLTRDYYHFVYPDTVRLNRAPHIAHKAIIANEQVHIYTDSTSIGWEQIVMPVSQIKRMDVYQVKQPGAFRHGIGGNTVFQPVPAYRVVASIGFIYSPRIIFDEKERYYLSLGIPMTLAFSRLDDSNSVDLKLGVMIDLPLILNYNHAIGTVKTGFPRSGYFIGGGFGFHRNHYTAANDKGTTTSQINGIGPVVNAGLRFAPRKESRNNMEIRLSYMLLPSSSPNSIFSLGFIVNF